MKNALALFFFSAGKRNKGRHIKNVNAGVKREAREREASSGEEMMGNECSHTVKPNILSFASSSGFMSPLPLTSTMTRRKRMDTPRFSLLRPVARLLPRWGTDDGRHRLGVNRVPFIWLDAAGGPIRQPKRGWGKGDARCYHSPFKLTSSLGTPQTTVKLIRLP